MQLYNSPYKTCIECGRTVITNEGVRAFYRSYTTQLAMNIPFTSMHFVVYELSQNVLNSSRTYHPMTHFVSGALAGASACCVVAPLDVCKTLLNTQERRALKQQMQAVRGLYRAFRTVYALQGVKGYFRGLSARIVFQMPSTAISWFVYESFKHVLLDGQTSAGAIDPDWKVPVQRESSFDD
jgi:solute carrier family 25 iron transporter 28/37